MDGIFISYRREDSGGHAGRLRDNLRARFGGRVFQDVDGIDDGEIFENILEKALSTCQVAVIVIGRTWLTSTDEQGRRRLDDPEDWVRIETRMLLSRDVRVIPVLVGGATMPRIVDLPEDLRALVKRQSRELRDTAWDADVAALSDRLSEILGTNADEHLLSSAFFAIKKRKLAAGGVAAVVVVAVFGTLLMMSSDPLDKPVGTATPTPQAIRDDAFTSRIDFIVDQGFDLDYSLLARVLADVNVQQVHIIVTLRDRDRDLISRWGAKLDVDEVEQEVVTGGRLRSPDKATYTIVLTSQHLVRPQKQLINLFYFAGPKRFGLISTRGLEPNALAISVKDIKQGEPVDILRKYLTALIPLTALQGQAAAQGKTLIKRDPDFDHGCLSDFSNDRILFIHKVRIGPEMCQEEYRGIATIFGAAVAAEYKAILERAARKSD